MSIDSREYVSKYAKRLEGAVDESAREEAEEQKNAVVQLRAGSGHVDLVKKPMNVEEGRGKLP